MPTWATLGGEVLPALPGVGWPLIAGVRPARRVFDMERGAAERVLERAGPITLEIEPAGYQGLAFTNLWAIAAAPSPHPQRLSVVVVDRRFWWTRVHVERPYNLRRRTADRRRLQRENLPIAITPLVDDVGFRPTTLFPREAPEAPWRALDVLKDVLGAVEREPGIVRVEASLSSARQLPVQDLIVAGDGSHAVAQALGFVVGANVTVEPQGRVIIYDARDGAENDLLAGLGPPTVGPVLTERVSHATTRPRKTYVLFDREIEVRMDTRVEDETTPRGEDVRQLENVLPIPDLEATMPGGRTVATGTWEVVDDVFGAWASDMQAGQIIAIDHINIRQTWFAPSLLDALVHGLGLPPSEVLARRLGAARQHYRQTYRIDRRLNDRIMTLRANRIGIIDEENGTRAPAVAYADWSVWFTIRSVANATLRNPAAQVRLMDSFSSFTAYPSLTGARPAPIDVDVVDAELGILRLAFRLSPFGEEAFIAPGRVQGADGGETPPTADPREARPGGPGILREYARLSGSYRAAVIVTVTPAAPSDEQRFHRVEVTPAEAEAALGRSLGPCEGPPWTIRVRPEIQTAWYLWDDARSDDVERALGLQDGEVTDEPSNAKMLKEVAVSAAAALYSSMFDRVEGAHTTAWTPGIAPQGSAVGVTHELHPDGQALTTVALLPELEPIDMMAYLPESARRRTLRLVDQRGP